MPIALDSNVMIYAEGATDRRRRDRALEVVGSIDAENLLIPLQAAAETLRWLIKKGGLSNEAASKRISYWVEEYRVQPTDPPAFDGARDLVAKHNFQVWDAVILAVCHEGGASVLLSEDMQDGFKWRGVTIANPFADDLSAPVRKILAGGPKSS